MLLESLTPANPLAARHEVAVEARRVAVRVGVAGRAQVEQRGRLAVRRAVVGGGGRLGRVSAAARGRGVALDWRCEGRGEQGNGRRCEEREELHCCGCV